MTTEEHNAKIAYALTIKAIEAVAKLQATVTVEEDISTHTMLNRTLDDLRVARVRIAKRLPQ